MFNKILFTVLLGTSLAMESAVYVGAETNLGCNAYLKSTGKEQDFNSKNKYNALAGIRVKGVILFDALTFAQVGVHGTLGYGIKKAQTSGVDFEVGVVTVTSIKGQTVKVEAGAGRYSEDWIPSWKPNAYNLAIGWGFLVTENKVAFVSVFASNCNEGCTFTSLKSYAYGIKFEILNRVR